MNPFIIPGVIIALIILFVILTYNKMVSLRNQADEAWSDIDVQLKRRYNLIPNIIETVKGYAAQEESVLLKVTEARSNAINATNIQEQGQAENMLSGALKSLFAVAESYPDLKSNENFLQLQNELVDTEDKIQAARRFFNTTVRDLNTKLQIFPSNIIAGMFNFTAREFFEIGDEKEREVVKVSFDKNPPAPVAEMPKVESSVKPPETPKIETPEPKSDKS